MIEKNNENSQKSDSCKLLEEDEIEIPNFKLLYRHTTNPERDKSSGASSDEETTSSSLIPIPDTLKQLKTSKWTATDAGEHTESETPYVCGEFGKSTGTVMNSLEELRKKYTLKNESSVALKMNSANLMLDDILNSANLNKTPISNQQMFFKKEESRQKTDVESEISTSETSVSQLQPCVHFMDHPHLPLALDFYSSSCTRHCSGVQRLPAPKEKALFSPKRDLEDIHKKKSLIEKLPDLQLKYKLQSVYNIFQKKRKPFTKIRKDSENNNIEGIPGTGCQGDVKTGNEPAMCKSKHHSKIPKKTILDLIESSDASQSDFTEREECMCTCMGQRKYTYEPKCNCPEVIPNSFCVQHIQVTTHNPKRNAPHAEDQTNENVPESESAPLGPTSNENESSFSLVKEGADKNPRKKPIDKNLKGGWKHCSKQKSTIERTDIYYFDHGNSAYYQTTDNHPMRYTECLVERTDEYATKFWAEFFGTIEIGVAFIISFILQLYRFFFTSLIRTLTVGLLQIFSDYFFKPFLTILFNGIIQPCLILAYNIATSIRDLCRPFSEIFGFFAKEVANILKSCRLVDIHRENQSSCHCENKV